MSKIGLLKFTPYYKTVLWGGNRIAQLKGLPPMDEPIGESWEISGLEGCESTIAEGCYEGEGIQSLLLEFGDKIMGRRLHRRYGHKFPLLVKFIDADKDLSIQVHPDDNLAEERHNCWGKTELWYTLESRPGAYIYSGLQESITPEELKEHIANNTFGEVLARFTPQRGDLFYLPAGRIHCIGAGNLILEVQQASDITYRVYDYNRTDKNGKKRDLHIDLALDAIDFRVHEDYMRHVESKDNREVVLKECPFFTTTLISVTTTFRLQIARYDSFRIVTATSGNGKIVDNDGNVTTILQGDTILVPAETKWVDITPAEGSRLEIVSVYVQ